MWLTLWATVLILLIAYSSGEDPPRISIGGWMENDFAHGQWILNSSAPLGNSPYPDSILVPATLRGLSLVCNATYPIEWRFHRERWGGRSRLQYALQSTRISDGLDVKGFSAEISFFSFESNSVSGNYTCQKVGYSGLSSNMYVFWEGNSPPYLTLAKTFRKPPSVPYRKESKTFILPCTVSVPKIEPTLTKLVGDHDVVIPPNQTIQFDPRVGFTLTNLEDPYGKYTCQVGDAEEDGDGDIIQFTVFDGDDGPRPEFNDTYKHGAYYHIDSATKELSCCSASAKAPKLKLVECDHPTICTLAKHTLHQMESSKKRNGSCSTVNLHLLRSGVFRCVGAGIDVVREYFFPIPEIPQFPFRPGGGKPKNPKNNETTDAPHIEPYYDWNEADRVKMMLVTKVKSPVYIGENRTFSCRVSHFYYSQGIVWGIQYSNETALQYISGREANPHPRGPMAHFGNNRHFHILIKQNQVYIDVTIDKQLQALVCFAPIWNSTEWGKKTISLDVRAPTFPTVIGEAFQEVTWNLNETKKILECKFDGKPMPTVMWKKGNKTFALHTHTENGTSTVTFDRVTLETHSEYFCIATNEAGTVTKRFKVTVTQSGLSTLTTVLVLSLIGLVAISVALVFMCTYLKSQKSVISHLTNLAFKDVASDSSTVRSNVRIESNGVVLPPPSSSSGAPSPLDHHNKDNSSHFNSHLERQDTENPPSPLSFPSYQKF